MNDTKVELVTLLDGTHPHTGHGVKKLGENVYKVGKSGQVLHAEHGTLALPGKAIVGTYTQVETNPITKALQRVTD